MPASRFAAFRLLLVVLISGGSALPTLGDSITPTAREPVQIIFDTDMGNGSVPQIDIVPLFGHSSAHGAKVTH
ncbi:MAG: hypothetical protein MUF81_15200 [Verrucomicrobia bacterium]|jgi:hypothetical protein|nr:hypothetical protein [Verrucomicrobiota bacterium]